MKSIAGCTSRPFPPKPGGLGARSSGIAATEWWSLTTRICLSARRFRALSAVAARVRYPRCWSHVSRSTDRVRARASAPRSCSPTTTSSSASTSRDAKPIPRRIVTTAFPGSQVSSRARRIELHCCCETRLNCAHGKSQSKQPCAVPQGPTSPSILYRSSRTLGEVGRGRSIAVSTGREGGECWVGNTT